MRIMVVAAICLGTIGVAAHAEAQDSATQMATEDATSAVNEIICRRIPPPTGSRIGARRICKTQHEWDLINREARDVVEEAQFRSKFGTGN